MVHFQPSRIIVTCGPSSEPIDEVRVITNFSTGELGSYLSDHFAAAGWEVLCLRGRRATHSPPVRARVLPFSTNSELEGLLHRLATSSPPVAAIFHVAALADFRLIRREDEAGRPIVSPKLKSELAEVRLILAPAPKIIRKLRGWFPDSKIVGWKYELEGSPCEVLALGRQQIRENSTDACVVNGRAWGDGFAFLDKASMDLAPTVLATRSQLCAYLAQWLNLNLPPQAQIHHP